MEDDHARAVLSMPDCLSFLEDPRGWDLRSPFLYGICDPDRNTPLLLSVKGSYDEAFGALVDGIGGERDFLDHQNIKGVTALALAAQRGRVAYLERLIAAGAQVDISNHNGSTALIQASHFGFHDVVSVLIRHSARVDVRNNKGTTALMRAAQEGHLEVVKRLLSSRCDVNARNEDGMNALMLGSQRGHSDIVRVLVEHRADIDNRTVQGKKQKRPLGLVSTRVITTRQHCSWPRLSVALLFRPLACKAPRPSC